MHATLSNIKGIIQALNQEGCPCMNLLADSLTGSSLLSSWLRGIVQITTLLPSGGQLGQEGDGLTLWCVESGQGLCLFDALQSPPPPASSLYDRPLDFFYHETKLFSEIVFFRWEENFFTWWWNFFFFKIFHDPSSLSFTNRTHFPGRQWVTPIPPSQSICDLFCVTGDLDG